MLSRADRSPMAEWWRTVDRYLLGAVILLMLAGVLLSFAASPAVAERIHLDTFHFVQRHSIFLIPSLAILIATSMLTPTQVRRVALIIFLVAIVMMLATLFFGAEVKGARRWVRIAGFTLQPSEFIKPAFVVITAWLFAENLKRYDIPGNLIATILFGMVAALLIAQPDFGQTLLLATVWAALFFMAGLPWAWICVLGGLGVMGILSAYLYFPHVAGRIDRFWTGQGDNFQVETGREAIVNGGWFGVGPGEGTVKKILPDAHTDFAFAVAAEEFGIITCMLLVALFAFIVVRGLTHAMREGDPYVRLATAGLTILFAMQSIINISVNLQLIPAKGMTLPFISYGGSSMLAMAITMGFVLALTRKRPEMRRSKSVGIHVNQFTATQ